MTNCWSQIKVVPAGHLGERYPKGRKGRNKPWEFFHRIEDTMNYAVRAFVFKWTGGNQEVLETTLDDQSIIEQFIYRAVDHETNRKIAEQFGKIITQVKVFPTENQGWMILDKHTKRVLHRDIKNKSEVAELCQKHGYFA